MNWKKLLAILAALALCTGMLAGCGSSSNSGSEESNDGSADAGGETFEEENADYVLINDGVLSVGCEIGYPPFEDYAEDGTTPIGFDIDIITEVASRIGLEVNIINTAWDGIFEGIDVNYDVVCSAVTITSDRAESMLFSSSYINNYQAVVVPAGSDLEINSFEDLDGLTVAVQKETTSDILMSDYDSTGTIDIEIVANEKVTSCFTQLTNGEVDVVCVDSTVADGYVASDSEHYEIAYLDDSEPEVFAVAMGLENTALQAAISEAIDAMWADGFIDDTYDYWFGSASED